MKVVLFCGGMGTRLREHSDVVPKPLVNVGNRPILWQLMKYYAHFGHNEFILCLGYKGEMIKEFFLNYDSYVARDFVMQDGGKTLHPATSDIADWKISFVDTGLHSNIGERLVRVRDYLEDEPVFLANYSDQLSDFSIPEAVKVHREHGLTATVLGVQPWQSVHCMEIGDNRIVTKLEPVSHSSLWVNGGFMVLSRQIFDVIEEGEDLVEQPFQKLIEAGKLGAVKHDGFWAAMDTFKDKIMFDRMHSSGERPWEVWNESR